MKNVWIGISKLNVRPCERPVLLGDHVHTLKAWHEEIFHPMFDMCSVSSFELAQLTMLQLYSCGRSTCPIVDCGNDVADILFFYEHYQLHVDVKKMQKIVNDKCCTFITRAKNEIIRDIRKSSTVSLWALMRR